MNPGLRIEHASLSDKGRRSANEDCLHIDPEVGLYAVCDGAGGKMGGRTAAEIACRTLAAARPQLLPLDDAAAPVAQQALDAMLRNAHQAILDGQQKDPQLSAMTTTAAVVLCRGGTARVAHVGDSRIYLLRGHELRALTRDHSLENYLKDNPHLRSKVNRPGKTLVSALGLRTQHLRIDHADVVLHAGDILMICSDGLTDALPGWTVREILTGAQLLSVEDAAPCLVRSALSHEAMDNVSVVVLGAVGPSESTPHPSPPLGWLAFVEQPRRGEVVAVRNDIVLGADPGCQVVIEDGFCSSRHAQVSSVPGGFVLRDLGSTNGTYVNNLKTSESRLIDGDRLRVGTTEMIFKCHRFS